MGPDLVGQVLCLEHILLVLKKEELRKKCFFLSPPEVKASGIFIEQGIFTYGNNQFYQMQQLYIYIILKESKISI